MARDPGMMLERSTNILLVADEVVKGFGRLGTHVLKVAPSNYGDEAGSDDHSGQGPVRPAYAATQCQGSIVVQEGVEGAGGGGRPDWRAGPNGWTYFRPNQSAPRRGWRILRIIDEA